MIVIETPRLILRHLTLDDVDDLAAIYADPVVMKFYSSTLTYEQTKQQVERIISSYEQRGWSLWATIHKGDRQLIGRCRDEIRKRRRNVGKNRARLYNTSEINIIC